MSPAPLELFLLSGSPYAWRVQLALEHLGLSYDTHVLSISDGSLKRPEYLTLNPRGRVPTLRQGSTVIYESLAILAYLDRCHPQAGLFGADAEECGRIWQICSEYTAYMDPAVEGFTVPIYFGEAGAQAAQVRAAISVLARELGTWEQRLGAGDWFVGDRPTAADYVLYPAFRSIQRASSKPLARDFELPFLPIPGVAPRLHAWMSRVEALPGYARTVPPHWRGNLDQR